MPSAVMGQVGTSLRTLLNNNGFSAVKIIGYEHNWADAGAYPVDLVSLLKLVEERNTERLLQIKNYGSGTWCFE
jgi:hypothetical protein